MDLKATEMLERFEEGAVQLSCNLCKSRREERAEVSGEGIVVGEVCVKEKKKKRQVVSVSLISSRDVYTPRRPWMDPLLPGRYRTFQEIPDKLHT